MARNRFRLEEARAWLRKELEDGKAHRASTVISEAEQVGIAKRTLQLVSKELEEVGALDRWRSYKADNAWYWRLKPVEVRE